MLIGKDTGIFRWIVAQTKGDGHEHHKIVNWLGVLLNFIAII